MARLTVPMRILSWTALLATAAACGSSDAASDALDADLADAADVAVTELPLDAVTTDPADRDAPADLAPDTTPDDLPGADAADATEWPPPFNVVAAAHGFRLYYRERVERAVVAYNRFQLFGDTSFGITIGKAGIAREGNVFEVVPGPNDNNHIGRSVGATWAAYRVFRTRALALTLVRMFDGLAFLERVSGHDGLTGRLAYPGWTMVVDGIEGGATRTRAGEPVVPPFEEDPARVQEVMDTFFDGIRVTYREEPADILLNYMPARETGDYGATYGFSMLPRYLRVSDCCTSLMQVPEPHPWAGAFWSNHNSRDNFPDLGLGYVAALEAMADPEADEDVRAAAARAWAAGGRVGDRILDSGVRIMTVDEHHDYGTLVVSGAVRPDGETEAEDLGSMADCQMAFLARALSSEGLSLPLVPVPLPGSLEDLFASFLSENETCPEPGIEHTCTLLGEAMCKHTWGNVHELQMNGTPWLEVLAQLEAESPGTAEMLLGGFQDDFHEIALAGLALVEYARTRGDAPLLAQTREALAGLTRMMRVFGDMIYGQSAPGTQARRRYMAALIEGQAGLRADPGDLGDFSWAEQQMGRLEGLLTMADTAPAALKTDEQIRQEIEAEVARLTRTVQTRYAEAYGETPPVRRAGDAYEARVFHEGEAGPWRPVENTRHHLLGGIEFLEALPICLARPDLLDCSWARLGCARPDLDGNGTVAGADRAAFEAARETYGDTACTDDNLWCGGADLDRSGTVDDIDAAFMDAAQGCFREITVPR